MIVPPVDFWNRRTVFAGRSRRTLRARIARLFGDLAWYFTRHHPPGTVSFVMVDDESFWSEWTTPSGTYTRVRGVWSLTAYDRRVAVAQVHLQRLDVRARSRFPFFRVWQRVPPTPIHRRRLDGNVEADFILDGVTTPDPHFGATIVVVDQLNRRFLMRYEFAWRANGVGPTPRFDQEME